MLSRSSGIRSRRSLNTPATSGTRSRCHGSMTVVAASGSSPTIDRTLSRVARAIGKPENIVIEPIFFVPHAIWPHLIHGVRDQKEMFSELGGHVLEIGIVGR